MPDKFIGKTREAYPENLCDYEYDNSNLITAIEMAPSREAMGYHQGIKADNTGDKANSHTQSK